MNIRELLQKYGQNSNSFLSLYEGFQYFTEGGGAIPFIDRQSIRMGACDPLAAPEERAVLLKAFAAEARRLGKTAVILPVSRKTAGQAHEAGYSALMVGSEPYFDLPDYPPTGKIWSTLVNTAKTFQAKGATVAEFKPEALTSAERAEYDAIVEEWFATRKMDALGFLNQVKPWDLASDKKYFSLEQDGEKIAFVAAIPIWPTSGWYLIDVMRKEHPPAGSTELLLIEAMRLLKEQGAREISLGVAPLSGLEGAPTDDGHARMYRFLRFLYAKGGSFYNFDSLYRFKLKFHPSRSDPAFVIYSGPLGLRQLLDIFDVFLPGGVKRAVVSSVIRSYSQFSLADWVRSQLGPGTVVLSAPPSFHRLLLRCRLTVFLLILSLVAFGLGMGSLWAIPLLLVGVGGVEYLAGRAAALSSFLLPLIAVVTLQHFVPMFSIGFDPILIGVVGAFGAVTLFLKHKKMISIAILAAALISSAVAHDPRGLTIVVPYILGMIGLKGYFKSSASL